VSTAGYIAALCVYLAIVLAALYSLGDLCLLHLVLVARGITTYDYIMASRDAAVVAAAAAAASGNQQQQQPSLLAASLRRLRSLGPRSIRVRDESQPGSSLGGRGHLVLPKTKVHVALSPCQACRTPSAAIAARQHAAYQQLGGPSPSCRSACNTPRAAAAAGFDAAMQELQQREQQQEQPLSCSVTPVRLASSSRHTSSNGGSRRVRMAPSADDVSEQPQPLQTVQQQQP
jgi:hypothetical protein